MKNQFKRRSDPIKAVRKQQTESVVQKWTEDCHKYRQSGFDIGIRLCMDAVLITLRQEYGWAEGRGVKFWDAWNDTLSRVVDALNNDLYSGHKDLDYSRGDIDRIISEIMPEYADWDTRYSNSFIDSAALWKELQPVIEFKEAEKYKSAKNPAPVKIGNATGSPVVVPYAGGAK